MSRRSRFSSASSGLPATSRTDVCPSIAGCPQTVRQHGRGQQVFSADTATNAALGSVTVGKRPWGIALSPEGKTLYSANGPSNDISVVDIATNAVTGRVKIGSERWG